MEDRAVENAPASYNHCARGQPPRSTNSTLGSAGACAQGPHQIDHALANLGVGDLDEGAVQLKSLAAVEEFEDEGFRVRLRHAARLASIARDMRCFLEEELHRDIEDLRDLEQPARADAVNALLVFLYLLKRQPHALADTFLTHAK